MNPRGSAVLAAVALYLLCTCVAVVRRRQGRMHAAVGWALASWVAIGLMWLA